MEAIYQHLMQYCFLIIRLEITYIYIFFKSWTGHLYMPLGVKHTVREAFWKQNVFSLFWLSRCFNSQTLQKVLLTSHRHCMKSPFSSAKLKQNANDMKWNARRAWAVDHNCKKETRERLRKEPTHHLRHKFNAKKIKCLLFSHKLQEKPRVWNKLNVHLLLGVDGTAACNCYRSRNGHAMERYHLGCKFCPKSRILQKVTTKKLQKVTTKSDHY